MVLLDAVIALAVLNPSSQSPRAASNPEIRRIALQETPQSAPRPLRARGFLTKAGIILQAVRPERAQDFEYVMSLLKNALQTSTDPVVQAQAKGWRIYKSSEQTTSGAVVYIFLIDPAVMNAEYAVGPILAKAYPDRINEIWKLYIGSLTPDASLLSLAPLVTDKVPADVQMITPVNQKNEH